MGHTVLDALMISILRSNTNVVPDHASSNFNPPNRFPGEEEVICGRWDAISPFVRALSREDTQMQGETMFRPLAVLVSLLSLGADPHITAVISINHIPENAHPGQYHHRLMNAAELIEVVPPSLIS